jgi:chromosome segregation ATPase
MQIILRALLIISYLTLLSCKSALLELKNDNQRMEESIPVKQMELESLHNQNQQLSQEKNELLAEIDKKNITLNELSDGLAKIKDSISKIRANTEVKRKKQVALLKSLDHYSVTINQMKKQTSPGEDKKAEIEELRQQIKDKVKKDAELFNNN